MCACGHNIVAAYGRTATRPIAFNQYKANVVACNKRHIGAKFGAVENQIVAKSFVGAVGNYAEWFWVYSEIGCVYFNVVIVQTIARNSTHCNGIIAHIGFCSATCRCQLQSVYAIIVNELRFVGNEFLSCKCISFAICFCDGQNAYFYIFFIDR